MESALVAQMTSFQKQKHVVLLSGFVVLMAFFLWIVVSLFVGVAVLFSYFGGMVFFHFLFSDADSSPNLLFMLKRRKRIVSRSEIPRSCTICGNSRCRRHKADFNLYNLQPWAELRIPQEVDEALEQFLDATLNKYVNSWSRNITEDEFFVHELRLCLRFMVAVILRRSMKVDLTLFITEKLLKAAMQHLDSYVQTSRISGSGVSLKYGVEFEKVLLENWNSTLHVATLSRRQELQYLRLLTQNIMPFLVPKRYLKCKSLCALLPEIVGGSILLSIMDIIADPFTVNMLLLLFFDKTPMTDYSSSTSPWVEVLSNFVESSIPSSKSALHIPLSSIFNNQLLLYPFMKFMKEEAAINVLQFCLAVEDFNRQMLDPELTSDQLVRLHKDARHLYDTYCSLDAVDRIQLDKNVVEEIRKVVYGPPEEVVKLRTTAPLFKSYDQTYNLLENVFCPLFYQSDNYFTLLCGQRLSENSDAGAGRSSRKETSTVAKFGSKFNKIKGVFKPPTIEGKMDDFLHTDFADAVYPEEIMCSGAADMNDFQLTSRDMSAWRVCIPVLDTQLEEGWKLYYVYLIEVQSIDTRGNVDPDAQHWQVKRRNHEFYVLEAKLTEFHGELEDAHLPPKRGHANKGFEFAESRRKVFEEFLQKLLAKPHLRNSELLYAFLTPSAEFSTTMLPDINLGKMIKTMPMKLMKERGQHLEPFLQSFLQSTEGAKPRPSKLECRDIRDVPESRFSQRLLGTSYGNNANLARSHRDSGRIRPEFDIIGLYDYILYLAVRIFDVPKWCLQCCMALRMIAKSTLEALVTWYIDLKLEQALAPRRLAQLIHLLKSAVYENPSPAPSNEERETVAKQMLIQFHAIIPSIVVKIIGKEKFDGGTKMVFELLQCPRLNKQLSYTLLDIVATELFPELAWPSRPSRSSFSE